MAINEEAGDEDKDPDFNQGAHELQEKSDPTFMSYRSIIKEYHELGREDLPSLDKPKLLQLADDMSSKDVVCPEHIRKHTLGWLAYELGDMSERENNTTDASAYFEAALNNWSNSRPETHDAHLWLNYTNTLTMLRLEILEARETDKIHPNLSEVRMAAGRLAFDAYQLAQQQVESGYRDAIRGKAAELLVAAVILQINEQYYESHLIPFPAAPRQDIGEPGLRQSSTGEEYTKKTSRDLIVQVYSKAWEPMLRVPVQIKNSTSSNGRGGHDQNVVKVIYCKGDLGVRTDHAFREMAMALTHPALHGPQSEKIKRAQDRVLSKLRL